MTNPARTAVLPAGDKASGMTLARAALALAVLMASVLCVRLGVWQLERADQSETVADTVADRQRQPALRLNGAAAGAELLPYRTAVAVGRFEPGARILLDNRKRDGRLGYELVVPFRIAGSDTRVMVNRGWIPRGAVGQPPESRGGPVRGVLLKPAVPPLAMGVPPDMDSPWPYLDIEAVGQHLGAPVLRLVLVEDERLAREAVEDGRRRADKWGMHMGYAIQWFVFAVIGLALFGYMLRTGRR